MNKDLKIINCDFSTGTGKSMKTAIGIVNMEDDYVLKVSWIFRRRGKTRIEK